MHFRNETPWSSFWALSFGRDGRERLVVVAKATYALTEEVWRNRSAPDFPPVATEQQPLIEADVFEGEPGSSAPRLETDFAHAKIACDVMLVGSAYADDERRTRVELGVGGWAKRFVASGPRVWRQSIAGVDASRPERFSVMPLSYAQAFGGVDAHPKKPEWVETFEANPVGVGFHPLLDDVDGRPMPRTEGLDQPIKSPRKRTYQPFSLGPIGRNWSPRPKLAGTYDERWLDERSPYLPEDFDDRYYQSAPPDQQVPHPSGGELVRLVNLTPDRLAQFRLPNFRVPVIFVESSGLFREQAIGVDTVLIAPDEGRLSLAGRTVYYLERSAFDVQEVVVGGRGHSWHLRQRARQKGKAYYPSLGALVRARSGGRT